MRLTNKIKSLRAEVRVSVSGGFSNVFLSNCKSCRIFLYDMVVRPDKIEATVSPAALNGVFAAAKNAGMHVQILSRKGLRYFLLRYRKRYGVTAGVFLFAFLLTVLSSFLWRIEIRGVEQTDGALVNDVLSVHGIRTGTFLCRIDTEALSSEIESTDPHIRWANVNLIGCCLYIDITERSLPPTAADAGDVFHLAASKNGTILLADISAGEPLVKPGDVVKKGDLLASGAVLMKNGEFRYTGASGRILAETKCVVRSSNARTVPIKKIIKSNSGYRFLFFGCSFPVVSPPGKAAENILMNDQSYLSVNRDLFPIGFCSEKRVQLETERYTMQKEQAFLTCAYDMATQSVRKLKKSRILSRVERFGMRPEPYYETEYVCEEDIAKKMPFDRP